MSTWSPVVNIPFLRSQFQYFYAAKLGAGLVARAREEASHGLFFEKIEYALWPIGVYIYPAIRHNNGLVDPCINAEAIRIL